MKVSDDFSIVTLLKKTAKANDRLWTVYARLTIGGLRADVSLGVRVVPRQWDSKNGLVVGVSREDALANNAILNAIAELKELYLKLVDQYEYITAAMLKMAYRGKLPDAYAGRKGRSTFLAAIDFELGMLNEKFEKGIRAPATIVKWECFRNKMASFIRHHFDKPDISLDDIQADFAGDLLHYLLTVNGMSHNSAMKEIRSAKQVLDTAVGRWILMNPIRNFRCTHKEIVREVLTMDEVKRLINKDLQSVLDRVRDVFLFSCFTGLAYNEVYHLGPENLFIGGDDGRWLHIMRRKTGNPEELPLLPIPESIIEKYRFVEKPAGKLLPVYSNVQYNLCLKELAVVCGIDKKLTTHIARHTFATTIALEHGVPMETVSRILGHRHLVTTQIYAKVTKVKISRDMAALREKLSGSSGLRTAIAVTEAKRTKH
jgi:site-specific recombinase XerD